MVDAIAAALVARAAEGGVDALKERRDLEPATVEVLGFSFGDRVEKSRKVGIPHWGLVEDAGALGLGGSVGQVDIVVRAVSSDGFSFMAELKWCGAGRDVLIQGIWDCFKMALATQRSECPRAFLLSGAHERSWRRSSFADLFDDKDHDPVELCMRDVGGRDHRSAWDCLLEGGYNRYPAAVPARLRTTVVGRASIGDWELRAVEVLVITRDWIPFVGGWPKGERPVGARYPTANPTVDETGYDWSTYTGPVAPQSRFDDTDDDVQWDPATFPENKALIEKLNAADERVVSLAPELAFGRSAMRRHGHSRQHAKATASFSGTTRRKQKPPGRRARRRFSLRSTRPHAPGLAASPAQIAWSHYGYCGRPRAVAPLRSTGKWCVPGSGGRRGEAELPVGVPSPGKPVARSQAQACAPRPSRSGIPLPSYPTAP